MASAPASASASRNPRSRSALVVTPESPATSPMRRCPSARKCRASATAPPALSLATLSAATPGSVRLSSTTGAAPPSASRSEGDVGVAVV